MSLLSFYTGGADLNATDAEGVGLQVMIEFNY